MNAEREARTEAWKTQRAEWLDDEGKVAVALARSWFVAGWEDCAKWRESRPITDEQVEAACSAHAAKVGDPATWEWIVRVRPDVASLNRKQMRAALEAARGVQS